MSYDDPKTIGSVLFACSEEIKNLSLLKALQRLLALALDTVRSSGCVYQKCYYHPIDTIMGIAIKMLQQGNGYHALTI